MCFRPPFAHGALSAHARSPRAQASRWTPSTACSSATTQARPARASQASLPALTRIRPRCAGYSTFRGERLDGPALLALLEGLSANGLVAGAYSHLLTGYIGSLSFLRAVADAAATLRAGNPDLVYGAHAIRAASALTPAHRPR